MGVLFQDPVVLLWHGNGSGCHIKLAPVPRSPEQVHLTTSEQELYIRDPEVKLILNSAIDYGYS